MLIKKKFVLFCTPFMVCHVTASYRKMLKLFIQQLGHSQNEKKNTKGPSNNRIYKLLKTIIFSQTQCKSMNQVKKAQIYMPTYTQGQRKILVIHFS